MNLPNRISLFRLMLLPLIVILKVFPYAQFGFIIPNLRFGFISISLLNLAVFILFLVASISDFLDGYIARKYNQVTTFGKFIDPIADKALTSTMFILFAVEGIIPVAVVLVMIWRDILVDGLRMLAAEKGVVMSAGILGKAKTAVQMIAIIVILLNNLPFALWGLPVADMLVWLSLLLSIGSGVMYFFGMKELVFESQ